MAYRFSKILALFNLIVLILAMLGLMPFKMLSLATILLSFVLVLTNRKFKPLALFFVFAFFYIYVSIPHFFDGVPLSSYTDFMEEKYYNQVLVIHSLMILVIALILPEFNKPFVLKDLISFRESVWTFYVIIVGMLFLIFFSQTGTSIFESSGYGADDFETENLGGLSLFEYFLVLVPVAFVYTNNCYKRKIILIVCCIIYCVKGLLFGSRVESLQCGLLIFIFFFDNEKRNFGRLLLISLLPLYALVVFGALRQNPLLIFLDFEKVMLRPFTDPMSIFGNQSNVYYSSNRLVGMVNNGAISYWDRLGSFSYNLVAPIVPFGRLPEIANLAGLKKDLYPAGGGGLISVYFWVFLSYPGVILIGLYIGNLFRKIRKTRSTYFILYLIMALSTYPRWIGYNPITLFKLSLYVIPFYFLMRYVVEMVFKNYNRIEKARDDNF